LFTPTTICDIVQLIIHQTQIIDFTLKINQVIAIIPMKKQSFVPELGWYRTVIYADEDAARV